MRKIIVFLFFTMTLAFHSSCSKDGEADGNNSSSFLSVTVNNSNHSAVKLNKSSIAIPDDSWLTDDIDFASRSGVVVENEAIYALTEDGIAKINRENGQIGWNVELCDFPEGNLCLYQNTIFTSSDECFYAIDKKTGNSIWSIDLQHPISTTPIVINNKVIISDESKGVYALNILNGELDWFYAIVEGSHNSIPLFSDNKLFIASAYGMIHTINPETGAKINIYKTCSDPSYCSEINTPIMLVDDNLVFANVSSDVFAITKEGTVIWKYKHPSPTKIQFKGIAYAAGKIILTGRTNESKDITLCIEKTNGTLLWQYIHGNQNKISHPMIVNESFVLIGSSVGLDNLDINTGKLIWNKKVMKASSSSVYNQCNSHIAVTDEDIIYISTDGNLVRVKL